MKARVSLIKGMCFLGESESGHGLLMDAKPEFGGQNLAQNPVETMLIAMGGCSGIDITSILRKSRAEVEDCILELSAERAENPPKVFTRVHAHVIVKGKGLTDAMVRKAVDLTAEKYCSVAIMIGKTAEVTYDYEIVDTSAA